MHSNQRWMSFCYLMVLSHPLIDNNSQMPELAPIQKVNSESCEQIKVNKWVCGRWWNIVLWLRIADLSIVSGIGHPQGLRKFSGRGKIASLVETCGEKRLLCNENFARLVTCSSYLHMLLFSIFSVLGRMFVNDVMLVQDWRGIEYSKTVFQWIYWLFDHVHLVIKLYRSSLRIFPPTLFEYDVI
jgi:hypothetical protein